MKKFYFSIMLLAVPLLCFPAEDKKVFATDGAVWNVRYKPSGMEFAYALIGDTTIAGKQYGKLYAICDSTLEEPRRHRDFYVGGFREENQQVWFRPGETNSEKIDEFIMYDFSKKAGDRFDHQIYMIETGLGENYTFVGPMDNTTIIKEVWTDEQDRRHFIVEATFIKYKEEWIEGVGGTSGLFWTYQDIIVGSSSSNFMELMCVKQDESIIYLINPECDRCFCNDVVDVGVGLLPSPASKAEVTLWPNPVSEQLNINIADEVVPCVINLYSATGDFVTGKRLTKAQDQMSMTGVEAGLYVYRIATDGGELLDAGKVIKE